MADQKLPRTTPIAAFGIFFCCIGVIWTILEYMKLCDAVNRVKPDAKLQFFWMFVPILSALKLSDTIKALNALNSQYAVGAAEVPDNIVLNLFFAMYPMYLCFDVWNKIADKMEGAAPANQ